MGFWQDLGAHLKGMGEGVVSIFQGVGANIQANAAYNNSVANLNNAQAENYNAIMQQAADAEKAQQQQAKMLIGLLIAFPVLLILAIIILNRNK